MKSYALVLHFDEKASTVLSDAIRKIADVTGNEYMFENSIAPHITVGAFLADDETEILKATDVFASQITSGNIVFSETDCFKPFVLFASPVKNEYLIGLNAKISEMLDGKFEAADNGNYKPDRWHPHCTLACRLDDVQFSKAVSAVENIAFPIEAKAIELALAECNPYKELKVWKIN